MLPTYQRLTAVNTAWLKLDLRLIIEEELTLLNRGAKIIFNADPVTGEAPAGGFPVKEPERVPALRGRILHGKTGFIDEIIQLRAILRKTDDTPAQSQRDFLSRTV